MRLIFYTNGNSRKLKMGNRTVELKHVNPSRLVGAGRTSGTVISALLYIGKVNVTNETIGRVKSQISRHDFECVLMEIENLPVWLANALYHYKKSDVFVSEDS